jgi:DNA-binding NarL/FixJ family response regulator
VGAKRERRGADGAGKSPALSAPRGLVVDRFELGDDRYALLEWPARARSVPAHLSPSERDVLALVLAGLSNRQIAEQRHRSLRTVAHQVDSIFRRLGVGSRLELFAMFSRGGGEAS